MVLSHAVPPTTKTHPLAYFITCSTYGSWFHGDERGSTHPGNNVFGDEPSPPNPIREGYEASRLKGPAVVLDEDARRVVDRTVREVCTHKGWELHSLNVRTKHIHFVVGADRDPEHVMGAIKAWCSRRLVEAGLVARGARIWTRHGSTKYLWDEKGVVDASNYVLNGQGEALI